MKLIQLALLFCLPLLVNADESPSATIAAVKRVNVKSPRLPWHTCDLYWNFVEATDDIKSLSVDFTIDRDVPSTCNLYIAPLGGQKINDIMFYGGLQTNINGWPSQTEERRVHRGKGAIFSRWGEGKIDPDFARGEADSLYESAGYEGDFVSVRRPLKWGAGTYTYTIRKRESVVEDGQDYTWFGCLVTDHQTKKEHTIGALKFEGKSFKFGKQSTSFVEIYSTAKIRFSPVPEVNVRFSIPKINGIPGKVRNVLAYYPSTGGGGSPDLATASVDGDGVLVKLAPKLLERADKDRKVWLKLGTQ